MTDSQTQCHLHKCTACIAIEPEINDQETNEQSQKNEAVEIQDGPDNSPTSTPTAYSCFFQPSQIPLAPEEAKTSFRMKD